VDGFKLEDFDSEVRDGGRTLVLRFTAGDITHSVEHQLDVMIYRGVFRDGDGYLPGDTCTWAGSLWHCDEPTTEKPGEGSKAWKLVAKRGRDGASVKVEDVTPRIDAKIQEAEERLSKRLEMALKAQRGF